jgi:hypothetical protein
VSTAAQPRLEPGRVYRTADLAAWSANPTRLANRLVRQGALVRLRHGLFAAPRTSRFGAVPPSDEALLDAFLGGGKWLFTGPPAWNALGLGSTAMFALPLVYNAQRSGVFELGGRRFVLRRVRFPDPVTPEWFVVDLLSHASSVGASLDDLAESLASAVRAGRFDREALNATAREYASQTVRARVAAATS